MSKQANPTLIGAFVLGAIILGAVTTMLLAGGQLFQERRRHVLYFEGAAQGLQVGAPVVFLGVKVGTVKRIQLGLDAENRRFMVPVIIEVEADMVQSLRGDQVDLQDRDILRQLVEQGLRAQLKMQSLLTGQLYVDLDFHPDKPARFIGGDSEESEIPTIPTTVEEFATTLEGFPMEEFLTDLAAISQSLNALLSSEETKMIPVRLEATLTHLQSLSAKLDRDGDPVLTEMRAALEATQAAMVKIGEVAEAGSPVVASLGKASEELAKTAQALQKLTGEESPTVQHLDTALREISRAARALRLLAETLEQQPEAIVQGKRIQGEGK
ncbi:MAG: MCE family protein [Deltaproteobacteria bacterium]|jgi:paraquat-inducible protein B|uniref:MlaD family protein n=1 Tax=Hydrosulfovibrio ferrireducens TaxID=2934181 RepID=UPI00121CE3AB|nr:MAG: MCE family protein [Deltaproteobacteria bacterium]